MKICNWKDCIRDRHKWKKIVENPKYSIIEVVEPEEEEEEEDMVIPLCFVQNLE